MIFILATDGTTFIATLKFERNESGFIIGIPSELYLAGHPPPISSDPEAACFNVNFSVVK